jgi:hypothetical protein
MADELSRYIQLLRKWAGLPPSPPPVVDASGPSPDETVPVILLNAGDGEPWRNGYSWRLGGDRLEIYGDSGRGLCSGVFDFLDALGIRWPGPDREELPPAGNSRRPPHGGRFPSGSGGYPLERGRAHVPSGDEKAGLEKRRRIIIPSGLKPKKAAAVIRWAARNRYDAIVVSLQDSVPENAACYGLIVERGGRDLSLLVPRRHFFFRRDLFRMEEGKRKREHNFCPTNPDTIGLLKKEAAALFRTAGAEVLHLWPERGHEQTWCSCPACRAFSAEDQYRIAVNAAADMLADIDPDARLSCLADRAPEEDLSFAPRLPLRPNVFVLDKVPDEANCGFAALRA